MSSSNAPAESTSTASRNAWLHRLALAAIFGLFFAMTLPRVLRAPIWADEFRTWRDGITKPLWDEPDARGETYSLLRWKHNADHAPGAHLLVRLAVNVLGTDDVRVMRMPIYLIAIATLGMVYVVGRAAAGKTAGLLAALMMAVDPTVLLQSSVARMYPPMLLGSLVAMLAAIQLLRHDRWQWRWIIVLGVGIGAGIWSHGQIWALIEAAIIVAIGWLVTAGIRHRQHARGATGVIVGVLLGMAIGWQGVAKLYHNRHRVPLEETGNFGPPWTQLKDAMSNLAGSDGMAIGIFAAAGIGWWLLARRGDRRVALFLAAILPAALINLLMAAKYRPVSYGRYLIITEPAVWIGLAMILITMWRASDGKRWRLGLRAMLVVALAGSCVYEASRAMNDLAIPTQSVAFQSVCRLVARERSTNPPSLAATYPKSYSLFGRYFEMRSPEAIQTAITKRVRDLAAGKSAGMDLPAQELWLVVAQTPASLSLAATDDPANCVQAAASLFGHDIARPTLFSTPGRSVRCVKITPASIIFYDADGQVLPSLMTEPARERPTTKPARRRSGATTKPSP